MVLLAILIFFLFSVSPVFAQTPTDPPPTNTPTPTNTLPPSATPTPILNPSDGIFLSEFMANASPEWVEIVNSNDYAVTLENWQIDDLEGEGGSSPKNLNTNILANGFATIDLGDRYLNNDGDSVRLINQDGQEVDVFSYDDCSPELSWSKDEDNWCQVSSTKGSPNIACPTPTPTNTLPPSATPTPIPTNTSSPTDIPQPTSTKTPTPTKKVTPTKTKTPTPSPSPTPSPTPIGIDTIPDESDSSVLGIQDIKISPTPKPKKSTPANLIPKIFIGLGTLFLLVPVLITKIKR